MATTSGSSAIHASAECCGGSTTMAVAGGAPRVLRPPRSFSQPLEVDRVHRHADVAEQRKHFAHVEVVRIKDQCGHNTSFVLAGAVTPHVRAGPKPVRTGRRPTGRSLETVALMSDEHHSIQLASRVRKLADYFVGTDLLRLRITREHEEIELGRHRLHPDHVPDVPEDLSAIETAPANLEAIKLADLVGIFHLSRPASSLRGTCSKVIASLHLSKRWGSVTPCVVTVRAASWRSIRPMATRLNTAPCFSRSTEGNAPSLIRY